MPIRIRLSILMPVRIRILTQVLHKIENQKVCFLLLRYLYLSHQCQSCHFNILGSTSKFLEKVLKWIRVRQKDSDLNGSGFTILILFNGQPTSIVLAKKCKYRHRGYRAVKYMRNCNISISFYQKSERKKFLSFTRKILNQRISLF
jgi:hypothetical protein